jgi:hypothetical protein
MQSRSTARVDDLPDPAASGDQHDAIAQLGYIGEMRGQVQRGKSGMDVEITRITTAQLPR